MNELNNVANVNGTYDNIPTSLTSNTSVVNLPVESSQVYCEVSNFTLSTVTLSLTNVTNEVFSISVITGDV